MAHLSHFRYCTIDKISDKPIILHIYRTIDKIADKPIILHICHTINLSLVEFKLRLLTLLMNFNWLWGRCTSNLSRNWIISRFSNYMWWHYEGSRICFFVFIRRHWPPWLPLEVTTHNLAIKKNKICFVLRI